MPMKRLLLLIIYLNLNSFSFEESIEITLFYESLCPDCRDFVKNQLYPAYQKIPMTLLLDLVPFGHAKQTIINKKWQFTCQHGPKECLGNKIQACAFFQDTAIQVKNNFFGCMMSSSDPSSLNIAQTCASSSNLTWPQLETCVQGPNGDKYLAFYGARTQSIGKLPYVPHILFNGLFNKTLEDSAMSNFLPTICNLLLVKPPACLHPSPRIIIV